MRGQFMQRCLPKITVALVLASGAACGGGTDVISPPPPPPTGLSLAFLPDAEDASTAAALGWQAGIPGLAVTLTPRDSSRAARAFVTSTDGKVAVSDLVAGDYVVEASRLLSVAERRQLGPGDDANGFATRVSIRAATSGAQQVTVPASRKRSLVISEWAFNGYFVPGQALYSLGGYLELANNADTAIYLDGLTLAEGFNLNIDIPANPCAENIGFTQDPDGVWARFLQRFPGTGRQYPLASGGIVVIATDAIDHRPIIPGGIDLSHADFEFTGPADVDNPNVPNMIDIGLLAHHGGHGLIWPGLAAVAVVAAPLQVGDLEHRLHAGTAEYVRIPRTKVLDGLWVRSNYRSEYTECLRLVSAAIDREGSAARGTDEATEWNYSLSRRRLSQAPGSPLQHTRSGESDFVRTLRNPGAYPSR